MPVLVDFYSESNTPLQDNFMWLGATIRRAQSFEATGGEIESAKFHLKKSGSPTGNAVAKIYAHSGTFGSGGVPTGSALATSNSFDVSTLTTSYALITFTFPTPLPVTDTEKYFISFEWADGDSSNKVSPACDNSSPTHAGNGARYQSSWASDAFDFVFYVYKSTPPGSITGVTSITGIQSITF